MSPAGNNNPLLHLRALGQSIWMDDIRRGWLRDGSIAGLIRDDGIAGITSNPAIFEKAISSGEDYESAIRALARSVRNSIAICETLMLEDVMGAADLFRGLYDNSGGRDGFVSIEVSPHLADDADRTVEEARRLWVQLARPNIMIKVPGTRAGLSAIRQLLTEGINVNITLLFGVTRYREVADAFLAAIEDRVATRRPVDKVASVASFFLSRIDTLVDGRLDAQQSDAAWALRGQAAVASARLAYQAFEEISAGSRWQALARQGAQPQRLLWASTSTKDKTYHDLKYVEPLIAPQTVNTLPRETLDAYRDHGRPAVRIGEDLEAAATVPARLAELGIDLEEAAVQLEREGVRKFIEPYDRLHEAVRNRVARLT